MTDLAPPAADAPPIALVVDDEPTLRLVLRRALARDGWGVEEAADGLAALDRLRDAGERYGVVFLDLALPGLSGRQLYERLRDEQPALLERLVIVSGASEAWVVETGSAQLPKPFDLADVRAVARTVAALTGYAAPPEPRRGG